MAAERSLREVLHNLLTYGDLSFRDFVEVALYHPEFGYYSRAENPVGKSGDYVTAPHLSPAFSFAIGRLVGEFMSRCEGAQSTIVDIGCGDGRLIRAVTREGGRFFGVDRALGRVGESASGRVGEWASGQVGESASEQVGESASGQVGESASGQVGEWPSGQVGEWASGRVGERSETARKTDRPGSPLAHSPTHPLAHSPEPTHPLAPSPEFVQTIDELPRGGCHLLFSNELFDAFPFARLVRRGEHLHELWVTERDGELDWSEHEAAAAYEDYFAARGVALQDGQFADISLDWEQAYEEMARLVSRGLIVTIDYGYPQSKLFHPRARRFGTAAAYAQQRVTRDLLANPGEQDLTAHINFTDLERAGERQGMKTVFFDRLARFLLGIGITEHPLFTPLPDVTVDTATEGLAILEARDEARRLVLPDGIGEDLRVLVQVKGMPDEGWSFQRSLVP